MRLMKKREMFLDVACFLIGEEKSRAIAVWDGSGWSGLQGFETLVNKCLLELVEVEERIRMHDHLRDMGREIASRQSPYRLWLPKQIVDMNKHSTERKLVRGIQSADAFVAFKEYTHLNDLSTCGCFCGNSSRRSKRLIFSNGLQILSVKGNEFTEEFASLSEDLVWLRWERFPRRNLPSWLKLKKLSVLELHDAYKLKELWQDNADPPSQLRELVIIPPKKSQLQRLPSSIGRLQCLKRLVIDFHGSSLPKDFCCLESLEFLTLTSPVLSSLPADFGNLLSLRNINLDCVQLSTLPDSFSQLIHLENLDLPHCTMLSSLPDGFGNLISLQNINMMHCNQLSTLPDSFKQLIHLEDLNLSESAKLKLRLDILENIRKLKVLNLSNCEELEDLPRQIMNQPSLTKLDLQGCIKLRGLPSNTGELGNLNFLRIEALMWKSLQTSLVNFFSLKCIYISSSESKMACNAEATSSRKTVKEADTEDCKQFSTISISNDRFPNLESFQVNMKHHLMEIETLPVSLKILRIYSCNLLKNIRCFSGLVNLKHLEIWDCPQIEELSSFADLTSLDIFEMRNCPKVEKIEGLEHSKSLKTLSAQTSWKLPGIQSLEKVERLQELELKCDSISALKPCIQSIKECPWNMEIEGSVIHSVKPIVNSLEFPDLAVCEVEKLSDFLVKIPDACDLDGLLCYVEEIEKTDEERKVVRIYVDTPRNVYQTYTKIFCSGIVGKKATVVMGKVGRVVEAFYQLLEQLE